MTGLDTKVLVRSGMQDDPRQSPRATSLIESLSAEEHGFVPVVVLVELVWVLSGSYGLDRAQVATVLSTLLRSKERVVDRAELVTHPRPDFPDRRRALARAPYHSVAKASRDRKFGLVFEDTHSSMEFIDVQEDPERQPRGQRPQGCCGEAKLSGARSARRGFTRGDAACLRRS